MKSGLLAGLATGTALAVIGGLGAVIVLPSPALRDAPSEHLARETVEEVPELDTQALVPDEVTEERPEAEPEPEPEPLTEPEPSDLPDLPETPDAPAPSIADLLAPPLLGLEMETMAVPSTPEPEAIPEIAMLPAAPMTAPQADARPEAPQTPTPPSEAAPELQDMPVAPAPETPAPEVADEPAPSGLPGRPVAGLINLSPPEETTQPETPEPATALVRNSTYRPDGRDAARMSIVFSDPGLPMAQREILAALDIPLTIALNPLDPGAEEAAELYFESGKEVLILATGLPEGATETDIDITMTAYLEALPRAVGMIDLPERGFARNAQLTANILPYLAQDGYGVLTFAGGLSQAGRAADSLGMAHAEVFRVLDAGDESAFTIRRFLDRAVFQASQMGHVIVFGDASNAATMEALEMWLSDGRAGQVKLVPVSGILLTEP